MNVRKLLFFNLFLLVISGLFSRFSDLIVIKFIYIFILPAGLLVCFFEKDRLTLKEFIFKAFPVNLLYIVLFTIIIKVFWPPLVFYKMYLVNMVSSILFVLFLNKASLNAISITKSDIRIFFISAVSIIVFILVFNNYLLAPLEDRGFKVYSNKEYFTQGPQLALESYGFRGNWERQKALFLLQQNKKGSIYFKDQDELIKIDLAIKGNLGSKVSLKWNDTSLGDFIIPFDEMGVFTGDYKRYTKQGVVFLKFGLINEKEENVLDVLSSGGDIYCEPRKDDREGIYQYAYYTRIFDTLAIFKNSELFLEGNRYIDHSPPLNFYLNSIGFLFLGKDFRTLPLMFLAKIFLIFLAMSALIETKKTSIFINAACLAFLFYFLKDYVSGSVFLFNDDLYTLNLLLFLYFTLKKQYLWAGIYLLLTSIVRFPGYFLGGFFLVLHALFFKLKEVREKKAIINVLAFSFLGMFVINIIYPSFINGFFRWLNALYFENFGVEHFSKEYIFSFSRFFQFIFSAIKYSFFTVFLVLFRKDKASEYLLLGIIPYLMILAAVEHPQLHYMFPIVAVMLVAGIRALESLNLRLVK